MNQGQVSSKRLMIVEDDDATREAFALILKRAGYEVLTADNGADALQRLRQDEGPLPRLIVLDLMMPVLDGYGFLREQQREKRLAQIPVIICTASGELRINETAPAADYIAKPVDIPALLATVRRYF